MQTRTFLLFISLGLFTITGLSQSNWTVQNLSPRPPSSPVTGIAMATLGSDQAVTFGGGAFAETGTHNQTWVYDRSDNAWTQQSPAISPIPRWLHAMSDITPGKVLMFGGLDIATNFPTDTWLYDQSLNTWIQKSPATSPGPRVQPAMAYIGDDKVVLFGGGSLSGGGDETWIYDLSDDNWTLKNPAIKPSSRLTHTLAYAGDDKVVLFGGIDQSLTTWNDETWVYDLSDNIWTLQNPVTKPEKRFNHSAANLCGDKIVIYGGGSGPEPGLFYNSAETWVYDLSDNNWSQQSTATDPGGRNSHAMAAVGNGEAVVFGGSASAFDDGYTLVFTYTSCQVTFDCSAGNSANHKVPVCHNGHTICVDNNALADHLAHGDQAGPCPEGIVNRGVPITNEEAKSIFSIYPNPGKGIFQINTGSVVGILRVINSSGQQVKQINLNGQQRVQLNLEQPGVYYLQLHNGRQVSTKELLVTQ